jgi:hypothetical protein
VSPGKRTIPATAPNLMIRFFKYNMLHQATIKQVNISSSIPLTEI